MTIDEIAASVLQRLEQAWNAGDGAAYGREYTDDAHFVNVQGVLYRGSAAIATGHDEIFRSVYAGSVNRMRLLDATPLGADVIIATLDTASTCRPVPSPGSTRRR